MQSLAILADSSNERIGQQAKRALKNIELNISNDDNNSSAEAEAKISNSPMPSNKGEK
jgi:hypothetical protein